MLALNAHPVDLILRVSQLAAWLEVSLSFFPFWFLCISTYFALIYYKVWSSGTQSVRNSFHYFKKVLLELYIWIVNSTFKFLIELPSRLGNLTKEDLQTKDDVKCLPSVQPKAIGNKNRERPKGQIWRQTSMLCIIPTILPQWFRN